MISELEDNRRGHNFYVQKMDIYTFLYLQYKSLIQGKEYIPSTSLMISNLDVSEEIKEILNKYVKDFPKDYESSDFSKYTARTIYRYFLSFRYLRLSYGNHEAKYEMRISHDMSFLVAELLNLDKNDYLADFYGAPDSFLKTIQTNENHRIPFIKKPVAFTKNEEERDFVILHNDIFLPPEYQINICKKDFFSEPEERKFDKIFAFIPVFQSTTGIEPTRICQNVIYSEDKTFDYIWKIINYLQNTECAVICISDYIFSEKAANVRKLLLDIGSFEGLIRFPPGEIEPYNLGSSLLIFNKNKKPVSRTENGFTFIDFCDYEKTDRKYSRNSSIISKIGTTSIINMFYGREDCPENVIRKPLSYVYIEKDNFNFDTKWNIDWYLENYDVDTEEWQIPEVNNKQKGEIKLSDNACISRGIQDTEGIRQFETQNEAPYRYLSVSDIQEGKINFQSMLRLSDKKSNWEKYFLKEGDVLVSKTAYPAFKIAIYEGPEGYVIPASNIYVIRMNYGESSSLNPYYLKLYLESEQGLKELKKNASGVKLPALAKENLENLEIPFKTEEEQKNIEEEYKSIQLQILNLEIALKDLHSKIKNIVK